METIANLEVKEVSWTEKTFITKRAKLSFDKLSSFFSESYGSIYGALGKMGIQSNEPPFAIYYSVDEVNKETDLAAAVSIPGPVKEIEGFQLLSIPESKALAVDYYGPYENMGTAYALLEKHISKHGYKKEWMLEQYFSDPAVEKDPNKWKTRIYFILKNE